MSGPRVAARSARRAAVLLLAAVPALVAAPALLPARAQEPRPGAGPRLPEASFTDGVLVVPGLGLRLPLGPGWVLRLPLEPEMFTFDHGPLKAHMILATAPWKKNERPGALRAVVQGGVAAGQNHMERYGPVSFGGLRAEEAYGRFSQPGTGPRQDSRVHLVGMHTDEVIFLLSLRAPVGSFDEADAIFVEALRGLTIDPPRPTAPAAEGERP